MSDQLIQSLIRRLDVILSLQMDPLGSSPSDQEKIRRFDSFGFTPSEIANILGSTGDKISKQLYVVRKKANKK